MGKENLDSLAELAREQAKRVGKSILERAKAAGKELSAEDRAGIEAAVTNIAALSLKELTQALTPEEATRLAHWQAALLSYEFVAADILKTFVEETGKEVLKELGTLLAAFGKAFARGMGVPIP